MNCKIDGIILLQYALFVCKFILIILFIAKSVAHWVPLNDYGHVVMLTINNTQKPGSHVSGTQKKKTYDGTLRNASIS